ncbi:MAG: hypothetical protein V4735_09805 [Pseudomonadota bacterium]
MSKTRYALDYNRLYYLTLDYNTDKQKLKVTFADDNAPWPRLVRNVTQLLHLAGHDTPDERRGNSLTFHHIHRDFTLMLGPEPIAHYTIGLDGSLSPTFSRPLTVDETRSMGTFHQFAPYPIRRSSADAALLDTAKRAVFTDIHTHSSGQITPRGLLEVAMQHRPYFYPTALMSEAGIDTSTIDAANRAMIPRIPFTPKERPGVTYPDMVEGIDLHALSKADVRKLEARMAMPADHQSTFTEMEHDGYRFRYPLTKDRRLVHDTLKKVAHEYAAQGIRYATLSFVGLDDPAMLRIVHDTMHEIEQDPATNDVQLRFMIGIPRGFALPKIEELLEKAKILLDSPYIVGVDILGYEVNKTRQFVDLYEGFAKWANTHQPGASLRVHAGENDKNHDNVKDFLKIAIRYPRLRFLVGHGLYGMDKEATRLAVKLSANPQQPHLWLEFNPASNIALNNLDRLGDVPIHYAIANGIAFVVSSDSAGTYQTSAVQLGLAAYHAGLDEAGFALLQQHQQRLMAHQLSYGETAAARIAHWNTPAGRSAFIANLSERLAQVPRATIAPATPADAATITAKLTADRVTMIRPGERIAALTGKRPIILIGASGESWKRIPKGQQRENAIAVDMLIHALGEQCYIVQGRNKPVGLSKVIDQSLRTANAVRAQPLCHVGMLVNPSFDDTQSYTHLTHMEIIPGQPLDLADAIVDHAFAHDGVLIAVGGAAFTRDIILKADLRGIRDNAPGNRTMMLLLANTQGASAEKAAMLHPDYTALDGRQLIKKLYENQPSLFPAGFALTQLNERYIDATARVAHYGYNLVDSPA